MYEQQDLWLGHVAEERVVRPPLDGRPSWERASSQERKQNCAHCTLCAASARKKRPGQPQQIPRVRKADAVRTGATGSITLLCAGHEELQRSADKIRYPVG